MCAMGGPAAGLSGNMEPLPTLQFRARSSNYARQFRITALVVFAAMPPLLVYFAWSVLLGPPDWRSHWFLIFIVEGLVVAIGLAVFHQTFTTGEYTLTLDPQKVELRYSRGVQSIRVADVIGMFSYHLMGDGIIVLRGRGGGKLYLGPGLSESDLGEVRTWLSTLAERNRVPIVPEADDKELKILFKADDGFWLSPRKRSEGTGGQQQAREGDQR